MNFIIDVHRPWMPPQRVEELRRVAQLGRTAYELQNPKHFSFWSVGFD